MNFSQPGTREAFFLAWLSLALTVIAFIAGLSIAVVTSSSATLGFALENAVDFLSSALVCWRFWGGGSTVPESVLEQREKRASVGIAIAFVLLAFVVGGVAIGHLSSSEAPSHVGALLALAVPSASVFAALGGLKYHVGVKTDSVSMRKDGLCSLCGAALSGGVIIGVIATESSHGDVWWVDAMVAIVVSVMLLLYGVFTLVKNANQGNCWWTAAFWRTPSATLAIARRAEINVPQLREGLAGDEAGQVEVAVDGQATSQI